MKPVSIRSPQAARAPNSYSAPQLQSIYRDMVQAVRERFPDRRIVVSDWTLQITDRGAALVIEYANDGRRETYRVAL